MPRIVSFYALGILAGLGYEKPFLTTWAGWLCAIIAMVFMVAIGYRRKTNASLNLSGVIAVLCFLLGYLNVTLRNPASQPAHLIQCTDTISYYEVTLVAAAQPTAQTWKQVGVLKNVCTAHGWKRCTGRVQLYWHKEAHPKPYPAGTVLLIPGSPTRVPPPANPDVFDYQQWLARHNIFHQHFISTEALAVGYQPPPWYQRIPTQCRQWASQQIHTYLTDPDAQALATALTLGQRDAVADDMIQAYATAGAMHILAVSGLHVGILCGVLLLLVRPFMRPSAGLWVGTGLVLAALWGYAIVTGLSPSVSRAATMCSFVLLGRLGAKQRKLSHTLAAAAWCMLCLEPEALASVGFQLSFAAVVGIVYFYPQFKSIWTPRLKAIQYLWDIICVSCAAQLATFPLALFYFHQFPPYFLIVNLWVIPLAFMVLVGVLVLLIAAAVPAVAGFFGMLVNGLGMLLNTGVVWMASWPGADVLKDIRISSWECVLLLAWAATMVRLLARSKWRLQYLALAFTLTLGWGVSRGWYYYGRAHAGSHWVVYSLHGHAVMEIIDQGDAFAFSDSIPSAQHARLQRVLTPHHLACGVTRIQPGDLQPFVRTVPGGRLIQWKHLRIVQLLTKDFTFADTLPADYVVISHNAVRHWATLKGKVTGCQLILDSSNEPYLVAQLLAEAQQAGIRCHAVQQAGAFKIPI